MGAEPLFKTVVVIDADNARRTEIYRRLAPQLSVVPAESVTDVGRLWPDPVWFLVYDEPAVIAELQRAFGERGRYDPIVCYHEDVLPARVVAAIYGGAINYVAWPCEADALVDAMTSVAELASVRCQQAAARLAARQRLACLTPRELDVVRLMRQGLGNKEVAAELGISPRTVEIHRANVLGKLGVRNSVAATAMYIEAEGQPTSAIAA